MSRLERIVAACGGNLLDGGRRALIPGPGHSVHDRSVALLETEDGRIIIHCFSPKDDWRDVRRALLARGLLDPDERAAGPSRARRPASPSPGRNGERAVRARRFWEEALPIAATPGERYLLARAIPLALARSEALRFHARMTSLEDRLRRPALLCAIRAADGALQGVQATLLSAHGSGKAQVATPRRVIGAMKGGAVRLHEPGDELLIAEGLESAASAAAALQMPAWALLSAHNLALFTPPPGTKRLLVAIDHDPAGLAAFDRLRRRMSANLRLECASPPCGAKDWNDWARLVAREA